MISKPKAYIPFKSSSSSFIMQTVSIWSYCIMQRNKLNRISCFSDREERYLFPNRNFISVVLYSDMKSDLSYEFPALFKDQILCQLQHFNKSANICPAWLEIANVSESVYLLKALGS